MFFPKIKRSAFLSSLLNINFEPELTTYMPCLPATTYPSGPSYLPVSHHIPQWFITFLSEPQYISLSHHITSEPPHPQGNHHMSQWATTSLSEPLRPPVSHHLSQGATTSLSEPLRHPVSHHLSQWATTSLSEPLRHVTQWALFSLQANILVLSVNEFYGNAGF